MAIVQSFLVGLLAGAVFRFLKFPVPAPNSWAGVAGVAGITAGFLLVSRLMAR